ncbi:unnamed protein product, partial [Rotaria sp. Silwood1]
LFLMEIDQEDSSNVFFGNTIPDLGKPARHTVKQRRWRAHRKQKLYSTQLSLPVPTVEQIVEQDSCLSSSDESFQDNLIIDDDEFKDNLIYDNNYDLDLNADFIESN